MPDLIKNLPNETALTTSPAALDLLLLEKYQSGGDTSDPSNNTYVSSNIFMRDFLASIVDNGVLFPTGTADEVAINAVIAATGRVVLGPGTFVLDTPVYA